MPGPEFWGAHTLQGKAVGSRCVVSVGHLDPTCTSPSLSPRLEAAKAFPLIVSDILHIDNLWQFEHLRKLQLDNNIIERIEGLENLTHLVWLGKALFLSMCTSSKVALPWLLPSGLYSTAAPVLTQCRRSSTCWEQDSHSFSKPGPALGKAPKDVFGHTRTIFCQTSQSGRGSKGARASRPSCLSDSCYESP